MNINDRDYSISAELPDFESYDDGRFRAYTKTADNGRFIVITDRGGMDYPDFDDYYIVVYRSEDAFGDDPGSAVLGLFTSDEYADIDAAVEAAETHAEETP